MNIEIANKLVKLRKQAGLSQEELADKLGLSRQAVSKWERAEASPDTDNLICLAKLYNVSLDDLLSTEDDPETIIKEQVKKEDEKAEEGIHIQNDGVHLVDDEGSEVIVKKGKVIVKGDEAKKHLDPVERRKRQIEWAISGIVWTLFLIAYLLLGFLLGMWGTAWILVFVPDVIMSVFRCIRKKRVREFNITFLVLFVFFLINLVLFPAANLWHPMWVVFLAIPVFYVFVNLFEHLFGKKDWPEVVINGDEKEDEDDEIEE